MFVFFFRYSNNNACSQEIDDSEVCSISKWFTVSSMRMTNSYTQYASRVLILIYCKCWFDLNNAPVHPYFGSVPSRNDERTHSSVRLIFCSFRISTTIVQLSCTTMLCAEHIFLLYFITYCEMCLQPLPRVCFAFAL